MKLRKISIILIFRALWVVLAMTLLLFIISRNIYTARTLTYKINLADSSARDYRGWYPDTRTDYRSSDRRLHILGEPVYMKVYLPNKFDTMSITGSWSMSSSTVRLGLKQADDSWFYKDMDQADWSANFDLQQAKLHRKQLELMISVPDYEAGQDIYLDNNWQIEFKR
ncbi:MAG: hypothetical protein QG603_257 [Patescibacteria group bacterium]|nr:hypothetical protein [Patescibacteria group bacterium]MDQ5970480.1 hypothetical protein [Patescibacteria group bacterium]